MTQVTEWHADQMCPAIYAFAEFIRVVLFQNAAKQFSGHYTCDLRK
jgi:hypothetical protein